MSALRRFWSFAFVHGLYSDSGGFAAVWEGLSFVSHAFANPAALAFRSLFGTLRCLFVL